MIEQILQWIGKAVPTPTPKNESVQIGCHFEEVAEMMEAIGCHESDVRHMQAMATAFKKQVYPYSINRKELLDALADQVVTATGVAHMFKLNIMAATEEVNRSNWSKFDEQGNPIFDENGKVKKGPNYTPPNLEGMY